MPAVTANIHCLVSEFALTAIPMYNPMNAQHAAKRLNSITLQGDMPVDSRTAKSPAKQNNINCIWDNSLFSDTGDFFHICNC